jgi:hypothetical protein
VENNILTQSIHILRRLTGNTQPNLGQAETYRTSYALYRELYPALKSTFYRMAG